jgi:hypothetical protein
MSKAKCTALVTGASGLAGGCTLVHLLEQEPDLWRSLSMRAPVRHWGCLSAFRASLEPILHFTNVRTPLFWQRPSSGWQPIRNEPTRLLTSPTVISSGGSTCGPSSPISLGWNWLRRDGSAATHQPCAIHGGQGPVWKKIVEKNGLQEFRFEEIAAWGYPDGVFASDYDIVSDTSKARRFGFHDLVDTEEMSSGCSRIFGVSGSFRDLPNTLAEKAQLRNEWSALLTKDLAALDGSCRGITGAGAADVPASPRSACFRFDARSGRSL